MVEKNFLEHIWLALRCDGLLEFVPMKCRGFIILDTLKDSMVYEFVWQQFKKSPNQGIVVYPAGFGNIAPFEQEEAIVEGKRYVEALKKMGLDSKLLVNSEGLNDITSFAVYVYVPFEQETKLGDGSKLQVRLRITGFGDRLFEHPIRHDIVVELTLDSPGGGKGWRARGAAPQNCRGSQEIFEGHGRAHGTAVINWLENLDRSMAYVSAHHEAEDREERQRRGE